MTAEMEPLPCCPVCGEVPDGATQVRGRTEEGGPLEPGIVRLEPCGHSFKAGTEMYRDWSLEAFQWAQRRRRG